MGSRRFAERSAVVAGGGSGLGRATCERLASEGATVWVLDKDGDAAAAVADRLQRATALEVDVTDPDQVDAAVDEVVSRHGGIDVMVNSAGIALGATIWETATDDWRRVIDVNLGGVFFGVRAALRHMIPARSGAVINIASNAGLVGRPGQGAYCASKGGVVLLTKSAALDAAAYGVRVNCVCPGFTWTPLVEWWVASKEDPERARRDVEQAQPLGRAGEPDEIAAAIAYLASNEAAFVTGVAFPVDGGFSAGA